jgi:outer membrane immunogenic protein
MKRAIFGVAAGQCLLCSSIYSGPPSSYSPAASPPTEYSWSGFYLGVSGGYTHGQVEPELTLSGAFDQIAPLRDALGMRGSKDFDYNGSQVGGLIGYTYQIGNCVIGLEGAGSYLWGRKATDAGAFGPRPRRSTVRHPHVVEKALSLTIAPRIGYSFGRVLPYVRRGLAVGDLDFLTKSA